MANNNSQPGPSAGSSNVTNNIYGPVGTFNQHNHLSTSSPRAPRRNPINDIELAVDTFIGRKTELKDIKKLIHEHKLVVITAMGGMGKTQLARKFASENADVYRDRYWINAETEEQLLKSFDRLAEKVNVKANTYIHTVRDTYRSFTEGAALLIFDNVVHVKNVYQYLPTRIQLEDITLHVLITSRWTDWTCVKNIQCYKLQPMDVLESLEIFNEKFDKSWKEKLQKEWKKLAGMLGYLPLALQVAACYIYKRNQHNSDLPRVLADYIKQLRKGAKNLLNDRLTEYNNGSIYASMLLTLNKLEDETGDEWEFAVILINVSAYMNPDRIEKTCLLKLLDNDDETWKLDDSLAILTEYSLFNRGACFGENTSYSSGS